MTLIKNVTRLYFFGLIVCYAQFLNAQFAPTDSIKEYQLREIVVTGTRTERSITTLPLSTQIITKESIQKSGVSRLNEIIREQTGLIVVPDFSGDEGIQLQGLDADYVIILIDGAPLFGRSAGTIDLTRISVNNIDRIEIVKGASSSLYGSEALAGVVNIITKKTEISAKPKINLNYKFASFNTHDLSTTLEYGKKKVGVDLSGNYYKTNGYNLSESTFWQTVEPYYNFTIQPKIKINISEKINLGINARVFSQTQDYKLEIAPDRYIGETTIKEWNNSILLNQTVSDKVKLIYDLYATNYKANEYLNDKDKILFSESNYDQVFYRPEIRSHYKFGRNIITAAVGLNYESLDRTYFEKKATLNSEYTFGQFEWFIKEKWNILAGFRYDNHHQYQSQLSPKIAVNYKWNSNFSLKMSIGYGYKAPDLRQLYFDFTNLAVGYTVLGYNVALEKLALLQSQGQILFTNDVDLSNPLKPESSANFNFGGYYKKNKLLIDYNIFYNRINNLIDTKAIAQKTNGQNVFSYINVNKIYTTGLETNATYELSSDFSISMGYQYLVAKDQAVIDKIKQDELFARDPVTLVSFKLKRSDYFGLYNRSKHIANIKINYLIPLIKTSLSARFFYRSQYGLFDSNNNAAFDRYDNFVKGYFLTNITLNKDFKGQISGQIGVNNLLDYKDENNISNLPGRQFFAKIQYYY